MGLEACSLLLQSRGAGYHGKLTNKVKNSQLSNQIPALSDDTVGFIAEVVAQFCPKMTLTVCSEYRHDGILFRGHSRFRERDGPGMIGHCLNGKILLLTKMGSPTLQP